MPATSQLARLLQALTLALGAAALGWGFYHWDSSPLRALVGALAIALGYTLVLGLQCLMLQHVSGSDSAPRPSRRELLRAWWGEVIEMPRVFFWHMPFRWRAVPDQLGPENRGRRGFVFVHGFVCNRGFWNPWLQRLRGGGRAFVAVNLEPVFGSIDAYTAVIDTAVRQVTQASGLPPVLVCHSMGGLAARAWLRSAADATRVAGIVTIGSPHHGTWLARFSHTVNGTQMRRRGEWLRQLEQDEARRELPPMTCWYSHCDNIVFPTSSAMLPYAENRLVRGPAHVELAFRPEVMDATLSVATAAAM